MELHILRATATGTEPKPRPWFLTRLDNARAEGRWLYWLADTEPSQFWAALFLTAWAFTQAFSDATSGASLSMAYLKHIYPAAYWYLPTAFFAAVHDVGIFSRSKWCQGAALAFECSFWPALGYAQWSTGVMPTGVVYCLILAGMSLWSLHRLAKRWKLPVVPRKLA